MIAPGVPTLILLPTSSSVFTIIPMWFKDSEICFQDFLLAQLELQEEVRSTLEPMRKRALKKQVRGELEVLRASLAESFAELEQGKQGDSRRELVAQALQWLGEARYWRNLQRALRGEAPR